MEYSPFQLNSFDGEEVPKQGNLPASASNPAEGFERPSFPGQTEESPGFEVEHETEPEEGGIDFAAIKFQRENTLLTNAERYAASIREEAELYVGQLRNEVEALNVEAEKRYEEARIIKEQAEQDAAQLIADAEAQVEGIQNQAHSEGFEAGRVEGLEKRYQEAAGSLEQIETILGEIASYRRQVNAYMEREGIKLSVLIAKRVLQQELKINKQVVLKLLARTLADFKDQGEFRVWLNPEDLSFAITARKSLEKFLDPEQRLVLRSNQDLPVGSALIETDQNVIDLTLAQQVHHVEKSIFGQLAIRESELLSPPAPEPAPGPMASNRRETEVETTQSAETSVVGKMPDPDMEPSDEILTTEPPPQDTTPGQDNG